MSENKDKMEIISTLEQEIAQNEAKIKDAQENLGDIELRDAIYEKAEIYEKYNELEKALETYALALTKTLGIGQKMDVVFKILDIHMRQRKLDLVAEDIEKCQQFLQDGGDWERKTKLKIYEGIYSLLVRNFKVTTSLFIEILPTFSSPYIISMENLVQYTVLVGMITLNRTELSQQIYHSPDINSVIRNIKDLKPFLESFFKCDYKNFFVNFVQIIDSLADDPYLSTHRKYYIREMRIRIYSQFLESYKTVTLQSIANSFGVSVPFIDRELSELISARRLHCKIDKVAGIVESEHYDDRNNHYKIALKFSDTLLNRVQKLSRIIDV